MITIREALAAAVFLLAMAIIFGGAFHQCQPSDHGIYVGGVLMAGCPSR